MSLIISTLFPLSWHELTVRCKTNMNPFNSHQSVRYFTKARARIKVPCTFLRRQYAAVPGAAPRYPKHVYYTLYSPNNHLLVQPNDDASSIISRCHYRPCWGLGSLHHTKSHMQLRLGTSLGLPDGQLGWGMPCETSGNYTLPPY